MRFRKGVLRSILVPGLVLLLLAHATYGRRYKIVMVAGDSMLPSMRPADLLIVDRLAYRHRYPERGDVAVARFGNELIVKRIVGLPGEELELREGVLYIDGSPVVPEHFLEAGGIDIRRGLMMGRKYALLGDNRALVSEPTAHAVVAREAMVGKVVRTLRWRNPGGRSDETPFPDRDLWQAFDETTSRSDRPVEQPFLGSWAVGRAEVWAAEAMPRGSCVPELGIHPARG